MARRIALVLAAGVGSRMNNATPKQFMMVNDKPLLFYSLSAFDNHQDIDEIYVVTSEENINKVKAIIGKYNLNKVRDIIVGGKTRQESVYNGLLGIHNPSNDDIILIHDSARPNIDEEIITNNIIVCEKDDAVNTVVPLSDSLVERDGKTSIDRSNVLAVQTPQTFKYGLILEAHQKALKENITNASDDASLVSNLGIKIELVEGSKLNFKVTTDEDLTILKSILERK